MNTRTKYAIGGGILLAILGVYYYTKTKSDKTTQPSSAKKPAQKGQAVQQPEAETPAVTTPLDKKPSAPQRQPQPTPERQPQPAPQRQPTERMPTGGVDNTGAMAKPYDPVTQQGLTQFGVPYEQAKQMREEAERREKEEALRREEEAARKEKELQEFYDLYCIQYPDACEKEGVSTADFYDIYCTQYPDACYQEGGSAYDFYDTYCQQYPEACYVEEYSGYTYQSEPKNSYLPDLFDTGSLYEYDYSGGYGYGGEMSE